MPYHSPVSNGLPVIFLLMWARFVCSGYNYGLLVFDDEPNQSENLKSLLYSIAIAVFSLD